MRLLKMVIIILTAILITGSTVYGQTKKVLFEEFSGAHCGQCPMGAYYMDSLLNLYPNVIGVSLHSYGDQDAMFFPEIDTIGIAYAPGAPMGATDRVLWEGTSYVAEIWTNWGTRIQSRLSETPNVSVSVNADWNSSTRDITVQLSTNILNNLPNGDYRFSLYIVEDSVTGTGSGYDQSNYYNTTVGNPFYGLGNPILGYVHKHVVRAILPQAWGESGIIDSSPISGQSFSTIISYNLPIDYDENNIKLVGFVSKFTTNHQGDEVLNVEEMALLSTVGISENYQENEFSVFPNPTNGLITIKSGSNNSTCTIFSTIGAIVYKDFIEKNSIIDLSTLKNGVYFIMLNEENHSSIQKIVVNKNAP